jgi:hypothetical protein
VVPVEARGLSRVSFISEEVAAAALEELVAMEAR